MKLTESSLRNCWCVPASSENSSTVHCSQTRTSRTDQRRGSSGIASAADLADHEEYVARSASPTFVVVNGVSGGTCKKGANH